MSEPTDTGWIDDGADDDHFAARRTIGAFTLMVARRPLYGWEVGDWAVRMGIEDVCGRTVGSAESVEAGKAACEAAAREAGIAVPK